jgi:xylulokinase
MKTLMGIDLGTTSLKAALFTTEGIPLGSESCEYPILIPQPGFAEQDPLEWHRALEMTCRRLKAHLPEAFAGISGIGICGQMHTQVYLDAQDRILRPAITWMDQRSQSIVERLRKDEKTYDLIVRETLNFPSTTYTALHARWVIENQPEIWNSTRSVLVAKDYLKFLLTGEKRIDFSEASGTLLFDNAKETWSAAAFDSFQIPPEYFPRLGPSDEIIGTVSREAAAWTGIPEGTPVANGSSDNSASALGSGMVLPGQVTLIIGTAGVITVCSDRPLVDPAQQTLCWHYALPNRWVTLGIMQTAGESLQWFKNAFDRQTTADSGDIFERYNQAIASIPDGSGGLVFLPYLNGERTPYWDPFARGLFFGINLATEKAHFVKAIMEGVSFGLRHNIETVESLGIRISEVRAVGGGLKSKVWLETLAKIIRKPISTVSVVDTANLGNILLCGRALGIFGPYEEVVPGLVSTGQRVDFPAGAEVYENQYQLFLELYERVKDLYPRL